MKGMNYAWNIGGWILGIGRNEHGISVLSAGKGQLVFLKTVLGKDWLVFYGHNICLQLA